MTIAKAEITPNEVVFDLSLIEEYSLKLQSNTPYPNPYLAHYSKGNKDLYYIATKHQPGPENETFTTIEWAIENTKPQIVIIEGLETRHGISPNFYKESAIKQAEENFLNVFEPKYTAYKAIEANIPFIGGEPSDNEIIDQMSKKGYSSKDVIAFYLLRDIPLLVDFREMNAENSDQKMKEHLATLPYYTENNIPEKAQLTPQEFKEWYAKHNETGRSFLQINSQNLAPLKNASYFEQMSADIGEIREKHLDATIAEKLSIYDTVLVVYGGSHLVISQKVFENSLGKGTFSKIR